MAKTVKRVKDTRTGRYVKPEEAVRRPATTVTETDKVRKKPSPPKKRGK